LLIRRLLPLVVLLLLVVLLAVSAGAGKQNPKLKPAVRQLTVVKTAHAVEVNGKKQTVTGVNSRLQFVFTTAGFPRFRARYFRHVQDADTAAFFAFRTAFLRVVEFVDTGAAGFDGTDEIVSQLRLDGLPLNAWSTITQDDLSATPEAHQWSTTVTGGPNSRYPGTTLKLSVYISNDIFHYAATNVTLGPNDFKFDVDIDNYVYHANNSRVALIFAIDSRDARKVAVDAGVDAGSNPDPTEINQVSIGAGDQGSFNWAQTIQTSLGDGGLFADTQVVAVLLHSETGLFSGNATIDDNGDDDDATKAGSETRDYYSFTIATDTQPTSLHWDPSTVINDDTLDGSSSGAVVTSAGVATVLAILASLF